MDSKRVLSFSMEWKKRFLSKSSPVAVMRKFVVVVLVVGAVVELLFWLVLLLGLLSFIFI